jgi:hypothetical protein
LTEIAFDHSMCVICGKPVDLRTSEADERGQPLHSGCAVRSTQREGPKTRADTQNSVPPS